MLIWSPDTLYMYKEHTADNDASDPWNVWPGIH